MFSSCNPKFFAVRHIHYPVNPFSDHFHTDAVATSNDHRQLAIITAFYCITTVASSGDHGLTETVAPSSDHYGIAIEAPSSDHCYTETVPPSSDHLHTKSSKVN